jgi:hypothetical protein
VLLGGARENRYCIYSDGLFIVDNFREDGEDNFREDGEGQIAVKLPYIVICRHDVTSPRLGIVAFASLTTEIDHNDHNTPSGVNAFELVSLLWRTSGKRGSCRGRRFSRRRMTTAVE